MNRIWFLLLVRAVVLIAAMVVPVSCSSRPDSLESTSRGPETEQGPAVLRQHAGRLLDASDRCEERMQQTIPKPKQCWVRVAWENDRRVPYLEARRMAYALNQEALAQALSLAAESPWAPKSLEACNWYLGALGKLLDLPYFRDRYYTGPSDQNLRSADLMNDFLVEAVKNPGTTGWRLVGEGIEPGERVQQLANSGRIVIGSSHSISGKSEHGHIAIVAPDSLAKETDPDVAGRRGPWIRYAVYGGTPHATKSTRTSIIFGSSVTPPIWVEYVGKDWRTTAEDKSLQPPSQRSPGIPKGIPEPSEPECVWCPEGSHCEHNPEQCVPDSPPQPEPEQPEPAQPEPEQPEPEQPEPAQPEPEQPEPQQPEPEQPEPEDPEEPTG